MKTDKEYPATHSMSTAWYFVDKDDNVAIFDIEDNGPIPTEASKSDSSISELCFDDPIVNTDGTKRLNFTDEQVELMFKGAWQPEVKDDFYWSDDVFQIDLLREGEFLDYLAKHQKKKRESWDHSMEPICLSKKLGIYLVDLDGYSFGKGLNNPHAKYLIESGIILRFCACPYYDSFTDEWERYDKFYPEANCPYYLYSNDWDAFFAHRRLNVPLHPMKLSQMPEHLKNKITRVNLRFSESEKVQIASETPCYQTSWDDGFGCLVTPEGAVYLEVEMPSGEMVFVRNDEVSRIGGTIPEGLPLILPASQVEILKTLDINKSFKSRKE